MAKSMGMMSGCYFVGREELLEWINDLLDINYTRVEDTSNGAAFCQVIDAIHPGTVAMSRVNYNATGEPEMMENYKILQDAFNKNHIPQYLDVPTLIKGKYMAALELFQWIHGYYKQTEPHTSYDPTARRKHFHCAPPSEKVFAGKPKPAGMAQRKNGNPITKPSVAPNEVGQLPGRVKPEMSKHKQSISSTEEPEKISKAQKEEKADNKEKMSKTSKTSPKSIECSSEIKKLKKENQILHDEVEQLNAERDFYYVKLRKIEDFCNDHENEENIKKILNILYETDENRGFLPPEE